MAMASTNVNDLHPTLCKISFLFYLHCEILASSLWNSLIHFSPLKAEIFYGEWQILNILLLNKSIILSFVY